MGGKNDDVLVKLLDDSSVDLPHRLSRFDASKARCFADNDRQKLLGVIEAAFGTCVPFNHIVRAIFAEKLELQSKRVEQHV